MRVPVLACLLAALGGVACERDRRLEVEKERLARMPVAWRRPSIHVAQGARAVTFSVRTAGGYYVHTPHGRGPVYRDLSPPLFAGESDRVFYWGVREELGRDRHDVVAHGAIVATPFRERGDLVPSRDGTRWAARGPVDDDATGAPRMAILLDGREAARAAGASTPAFSRDGTRVVWLLHDGATRTTLVVDGAAVRTFDGPPLPADGPRFDELAAVDWLADGRPVALVPEGEGWALYRGEERLAAYGHNLVPGRTILVATPEAEPAIVRDSLVLAKDAPVVVWWERMAGAEERWRVVRDGAPVDGLVCARPWEVQRPVVSDDGIHVAYVCPTAIEPAYPTGRRWVALDGRRFGPHVETWTLGLADDGSRVAYGAAEALPIQWWRVFVNGTAETPPAELVWRPRFAPDGHALLWAGGPEDARRVLAVDRRVVTRFDDLLYGPDFPEPRTAVWAIRRGLAISRIVARF